MTRFGTTWKFVLMGGLVAPSIGRAQDDGPADRAQAGRAEAAAKKADAEIKATFEKALRRGLEVIEDGPAEAKGQPERARVRQAEASARKAEAAAAQARRSVEKDVLILKERAAGLKAAAEGTGRRAFTFRRSGDSWASAVDPLQATFGLTLAPVDDALRSQLAIEAGRGAVAIEVKPKGLAEQAGFKGNDILLSLGGQPVEGVDQARKVFLGLGKATLEVKLIREGKPSRLSLVGPEHGFPPESSEYWLGIPVSAVDSTLRSHLADLPADAGLVANDVVQGSPADRAGIKKNDILVSLAGHPLKSPEALIQQVQASGGKPIPLVLLRAGKTTKVEVTPEKRAHPTVVNLPGRSDVLVRQFQGVWPDPTGDRVRIWDLHSGPAPRGEPNAKLDAIVVNPHQVEGAPMTFRAVPFKENGAFDVQLGLLMDRTKAEAEAGTARVEAQLKDLAAKLEEVRKAVDGMKKPEGK